MFISLIDVHKINENNKNIIGNVIVKYQMKHKTHLDNFTGDDYKFQKYIIYYNLIKGAMKIIKKI